MLLEGGACRVVFRQLVFERGFVLLKGLQGLARRLILALRNVQFDAGKARIKADEGPTHFATGGKHRDSGVREVVLRHLCFDGIAVDGEPDDLFVHEQTPGSKRSLIHPDDTAASYSTRQKTAFRYRPSGTCARNG